MIPVTKPFLPPKELLMKHLEGVYDRNWLTNHGPLVQQLEEELRAYTQHTHLKYVTNGTIALQIALQAVHKKGEVITTPFSYIATTSSIVWEGNTPVFVDVDSFTCNIDPKLIEEKINEKTVAILATHVYGNPCEVIEIEAIAKKYNIPIIYDAAHCFGTKFQNKSIFHFGDLSVTSFHATKIMHTVEGGAVFSNNPLYDRAIEGLMNFGHTSENTFDMAGINGKNSEFHAAMGLSVLPFIQEIFSAKEKQWKNYYNNLLRSDKLSTIAIHPLATYNYAYFPLICKTEEISIQIESVLLNNQIKARRYFNPSLNKLEFLTNKLQECPISESLSSRVLCLPLFHSLTDIEQTYIIESILNNI